MGFQGSGFSGLFVLFLFSELGVLDALDLRGFGVGDFRITRYRVFHVAVLKEYGICMRDGDFA